LFPSLSLDSYLITQDIILGARSKKIQNFWEFFPYILDSFLIYPGVRIPYNSKIPNDLRGQKARDSNPCYGKNCTLGVS